MVQKPLDASDNTVRLTLRLTESQTHQIDALRGSLSRSAYLRSLIPTEPDKPRVIVRRASEIKLERHLHRFVKLGEPAHFVQGVPQYAQECVCGETKVGP